MSTTMDQIHRIREMYYQQEKNISEIASETGFNWKTVKKYVDMEDFSSPPPKPASEDSHDSKLDAFKPLIDSWLESDKLAPRKQRHTAKRVFRRLQKEVASFDCSYRLVAMYVSHKKKELHLNKKDGSIPLEHRPGEAQVDFGYADFYENGKLYHEAKYLVISFPYSNGGYLQLNYGENLECLLEGLVTMFEYIGGVPTEIWFDNTRTIVTEIIKGGIFLMMDHINSYKRKKLNNRSPYDAFSFFYGEDILKRLACKPVAAENIILKPRLLKKITTLKKYI